MDYNNIIWEYEEITYQITDMRYTPDFFIYDKCGKLEKIVEIRGGRDKEDIDFARDMLFDIEKKLNINTELILLEDLYAIYNDMPFTFNKVTREWIGSNDTVLNGGYEGENNPNYGNKHSAKTKNIIGLKSKERWQDPEYRDMMMKTLYENSYKISKKLKGVNKSLRETRYCEYCNKPFIVTVNDKKKYCSHECSCMINITLATEKYVDNRNNIHNKIKEFVLSWSKKNSNLIKETPYNQISTNLSDVLSKINEYYGVKDIRVITKAVLGEDKGRKEFLKFLKEFVEN